MLDIQATTNLEKKEEKKNEMLSIRNRINELTDEKMSENKFWGYALDVGDGFEYGRDVMKEGNYESCLALPYVEFPMFTTPWFGKKTA